MFCKLFLDQPESCNKIIIWCQGDFSFEKEADVPKGKLKPFKLFLKLMFNKRFQGFFNETFKYALRHADCYLGDGASEVMLYRHYFDDEKIWSDK